MLYDVGSGTQARDRRTERRRSSTLNALSVPGVDLPPSVC